MEKIKISSDTISDLGEELLTKHDIPTFPLMINLGTESLPDSPDMPEKIYEFVAKTGTTPKTAARSPEEYLEFFKTHKPDGGSLIHFTISSELSASYNNAVLASKEIENVHVVDTRSLSTGSGLIVLNAVDLRDEGKLSASEIAEDCRRRAEKVQASFVVDSLDFLHKGGRCSSVSLLFSNILNIKPTIVLKDGKMVVGKKLIAKFEKAVDKYIDATLATYNNPDLKRIFITYTTAPDGMVEKIKEKILKVYPFKEVHSTVASGTITSHCGKNTLGILYINDWCF